MGVQADPVTPDPNPTEAHDHVEPSEAMLTPADAGALAALDAALSGEPAPAPADGDPAALPAATPPPADPVADPDAPPADPAAPPADPAAVPPADPAATPPATPPAARPSDEFGELDKDAPVKTRERFETMKSRYDEVATERDSAAATAQQWQQTVEGTGATPEQFGMTLGYLKAVNSGTPQGMRQAYEMMQRELATLAEAMGEEVPGIHDPLAAYPDLQQRVDDTDLSREDALELARGRTRDKRDAQAAETTTVQSTQQAQVDAGLQAVAAFGASRRSDPHYAAKAAAIKPMIERVIARLPPGEWVAAISDAYDAVAVAPPVAAPVVPTIDRNAAPVRPTGAPGSGDGLAKQPGSAFEAVEMALGSM